MKLFLLTISSAALAGKVAHPDAADFDCTLDCYKKMIKDIMKCGADEEATQDEIDECANQAFLDWWHSCLGEQCGAILPEGVCAERCIPALEEGVAKCDEMLESGEISKIEHYKCVMGPGGPAETWELCTADCICEQPFCNCEPPETAVGYSKNWNLRDTTIICYN